MTWSTRTGKKGESRTGGQNREVQNRNPDVQTSDFLVKEEDEDKEVPGQEQQGQVRRENPGASTG